MQNADRKGHTDGVAFALSPATAEAITTELLDVIVGFEAMMDLSRPMPR